MTLTWSSGDKERIKRATACFVISRGSPLIEPLRSITIATRIGDLGTTTVGCSAVKVTSIMDLPSDW